MPEVADAGEEHGGVPGVAEADAVFVVLPAAGLDDGAYAAGQRGLQSFEREGGVGGHHQRAGAGQDGALVPHFPDGAPHGVVGGTLGGADGYGSVAFGEDYGVSLGIFDGLPSQQQRPHFGVDIAVPEGKPIHAPVGAIVAMAENDLYYTGGTVILDHGRGVSTSYLHMSRLDVKVGDRVAKGDVIGLVGKTGRATGPHLCWRLNWFAERLDAALVVPKG